MQSAFLLDVLGGNTSVNSCLPRGEELQSDTSRSCRERSRHSASFQWQLQFHESRLVLSRTKNPGPALWQLSAPAQPCCSGITMASNITPSATPRPSSLACDACRRKHLKCNGVLPVCGRCTAEALACNYTASRRGLGRRNNRVSRDVRSPSTTSHDIPSHLPGPSLDMFGTRPMATPQSICNDGPGIRAPSMATPWALKSVEKERLLTLFYIHFFEAHPFIVPRTFYASQQYPSYLELVICFIGHHYTNPRLDTSELADAVNIAFSEPDQRSVYRVQALILYAILIHSCQRNAPQEADSYISRAARIALELGLNDPSFARAHANGSPVVEESMRRTWWELHTVDVYLALIHRRRGFETSSTTLLPLLPCSQTLYEEGHTDEKACTLRGFDNRVFASEATLTFSSYSYRIEAIRLVRRTIMLSDDTDSDNVQALDNALVSWEYNLPSCHADVISSFGDVDLMLFQARCFVACAKIFLHFPRSELPPTIPSARDIACARNYTQLASVSRHHTLKAIAASKEISALATVPWPLDRHSPFFVCALVLGCIMQLAAASIHFHKCGEHCLSQHRDRVVLMLGALDRLGTRFALAQNAARKLRIVAETVFVTSEEITALSSETNSLHDSAIVACDGLSDSFWFDLFSPENMHTDVLQF